MCLIDERVEKIGRNYKHGENDKIDRINDLLLEFKSGNKESGFELYSYYEGMCKNLIRKWSIYYHDITHELYEQEDIEQDIKYWFIRYLIKFQPLRGISFSSYIKKIMNNRVRYLYQVKLRDRRIPTVTFSLLESDDIPLEDSISYLSGAEAEGVEDTIFPKPKDVDKILLSRRIVKILMENSADKNKCKEVIRKDERLHYLLDKQGLQVDELLSFLDDKKRKTNVSNIIKEM